MSDRISVDEFKKAEIGIGQILSAEIVEGADKLLRFTVDFGEEVPRQIVSGIRAYFPDPAVLVGTKCAFAVNLEPRTIRGFESNGMILAVSTDEGQFSLLKVSENIPPGSRVK